MESVRSRTVATTPRTGGKYPQTGSEGPSQTAVQDQSRNVTRSRLTRKLDESGCSAVGTLRTKDALSSKA